MIRRFAAALLRVERLAPRGYHHGAAFASHVADPDSVHVDMHSAPTSHGPKSIQYNADTIPLNPASVTNQLATLRREATVHRQSTTKTEAERATRALLSRLARSSPIEASEWLSPSSAISVLVAATDVNYFGNSMVEDFIPNFLLETLCNPALQETLTIDQIAKCVSVTSTILKEQRCCNHTVVDKLLDASIEAFESILTQRLGGGSSGASSAMTASRPPPESSPTPLTPYQASVALGALHRMSKHLVLGKRRVKLTAEVGIALVSIVANTSSSRDMLFSALNALSNENTLQALLYGGQHANPESVTALARIAALVWSKLLDLDKSLFALHSLKSYHLVGLMQFAATMICGRWKPAYHDSSAHRHRTVFVFPITNMVANTLLSPAASASSSPNSVPTMVIQCTHLLHILETSQQLLRHFTSGESAWMVRSCGKIYAALAASGIGASTIKYASRHQEAQLTLVSHTLPSGGGSGAPRTAASSRFRRRNEEKGDGELRTKPSAPLPITPQQVSRHSAAAADTITITDPNDFFSCTSCTLDEWMGSVVDFELQLLNFVDVIVRHTSVRSHSNMTVKELTLMRLGCNDMGYTWGSGSAALMMQLEAHGGSCSEVLHAITAIASSPHRDTSSWPVSRLLHAISVVFCADQTGNAADLCDALCSLVVNEGGWRVDHGLFHAEMASWMAYLVERSVSGGLSLWHSCRLWYCLDRFLGTSSSETAAATERNSMAESVRLLKQHVQALLTSVGGSELSLREAVDELTHLHPNHFVNVCNALERLQEGPSGPSSILRSALSAYMNVMDMAAVMWHTRGTDAERSLWRWMSQGAYMLTPQTQFTNGGVMTLWIRHKRFAAALCAVELHGLTDAPEHLALVQDCFRSSIQCFEHLLVAVRGLTQRIIATLRDTAMNSDGGAVSSGQGIENPHVEALTQLIHQKFARTLRTSLPVDVLNMFVTLAPFAELSVYCSEVTQAAFDKRGPSDTAPPWIDWFTLSTGDPLQRQAFTVSPDSVREWVATIDGTCRRSVLRMSWTAKLVGFSLDGTLHGNDAVLRTIIAVVDTCPEQVPAILRATMWAREGRETWEPATIGRLLSLFSTVKQPRAIRQLRDILTTIMSPTVVQSWSAQDLINIVDIPDNRSLQFIRALGTRALMLRVVHETRNICEGARQNRGLPSELRVFQAHHWVRLLKHTTRSQRMATASPLNAARSAPQLPKRDISSSLELLLFLECAVQRHPSLYHDAFDHMNSSDVAHILFEAFQVIDAASETQIKDALAIVCAVMSSVVGKEEELCDSALFKQHRHRSTAGLWEQLCPAHSLVDYVLTRVMPPSVDSSSALPDGVFRVNGAVLATLLDMFPMWRGVPTVARCQAMMANLTTTPSGIITRPTAVSFSCVHAIVEWCVKQYHFSSADDVCSASSGAGLQKQSHHFLREFALFSAKEDDSFNADVAACFSGTDASVHHEWSLAVETISAYRRAWLTDRTNGTMYTVGGVTAADAIRLWQWCGILQGHVGGTNAAQHCHVEMKQDLIHYVHRLLQSTSGDDMTLLLKCVAESPAKETKTCPSAPLPPPPQELLPVLRKVPLMIASDMDNFTPSNLMYCIPLLCRWGVMPKSVMESALHTCQQSIDSMTGEKAPALSAVDASPRKGSEHNDCWCPTQLGTTSIKMDELKEVEALLIQWLPQALSASLSFEDI